MEAVSKIYLKLRYYFKLCRLNLDLKSASEDACLRSIGKLFHNWAPLHSYDYRQNWTPLSPITITYKLQEKELC